MGEGVHYPESITQKGKSDRVKERGISWGELEREVDEKERSSP